MRGKGRKLKISLKKILLFARLCYFSMVRTQIPPMRLCSYPFDNICDPFLSDVLLEYH